jgi:hypothetical protein
MSADLKLAWRVSEVDLVELEHALAFHFGSSSTEDIRTTYYHRDLPALEIVYNRSGELRSITPKEAFTNNDFTVVTSFVERSLAVDCGSICGRSVIYCNMPLFGFYKFHDEFQVIPVPEHAPRPDARLAPHPAILEIAIKDGGDINLNILRKDRQVREISRLLALLVHNILRPDITRGMAWVSVPSRSARGSELGSLGYNFDGHSEILQNLTDTSCLQPLKTMDSVSYYERVAGVYPSEDLVIPDNLTASLERIRDLDGVSRGKILRAAYWVSASGAIWAASRSSAYVALVSALESLLEKQRSEPCPSCGKPEGDGPTAQFGSLVEEYLPGELEKRTRTTFYSTRSSIAHGSRLLLGDLFGWGASNARAAEEQSFHELQEAARRIIVRWLWDTARPTRAGQTCK